MATLLDVAEHRADVDRLISLAQHDLTQFWATVEHSPPLDVAAAMRRELPDLIDVYADPVGETAAQWYEQLRDDAGIPNRFAAQLADSPPAGQVEAVAGWGVGPLFSQANADPALALRLLSGGVQRLLAGQDRATISMNAVADPAGARWARVPQSGGCAFCKLLATRGAVYHSATESGLGALAEHYHADCRCVALPVWDGGDPAPEPPGQAEWTSAYQAATRDLGGAHDTSAILAHMRQSLGAA